MKHLLFVFLLVTANKIFTQVNVTSGSYSQNFGTSNITSWTNNSTFPGWYMSSAGSFQGNANLSASANSYNTGGYYSYNCGSDAKIGSRASSGAKPLYYGVVLRNMTGVTIKSIRVSYTGYQMSLAQNGEVNISEFEYLTGAAAPAIAATGATGVPALNFTQLQSSSTSGGNQLNWYPCTQSTAISSCIPVTIPNGNYILLRWKDDDDTGNDHHMAVDNVNVAFDLTGGTCLTFLPIELLEFKATRSMDKVLLNWSTATERNNAQFIIERSRDGVVFEPVASQKGSGNSDAVMTYEATDENPIQELSYYRLKQTDSDGSFSYSAIMVVEAEKASGFTLFPNPTESGLLKIAVNQVLPYSLRLIDASGQIIYEQTSLTGSTEIDLSTYSKGIYVVQLIMATSVQSEKILYR